jgi:Leucine-rich repeat (LRR) protein
VEKGVTGIEVQAFVCDRYSTSLYLSNRALRSLPDVSQCVNLRDVDLSGNQLTEVPSSLLNLPDLYYVDLSDNYITALPATIGNLLSLSYLHLTSNRLVTLPVEIANLKYLYYLDVSYNRITSIPGKIFKMRDLYIYYYGNPGYSGYGYYTGYGNENKDRRSVDVIGAVVNTAYHALSKGWDIAADMDYRDDKFSGKFSERAVIGGFEHVNAQAYGIFKREDDKDW